MSELCFEAYDDSHVEISWGRVVGPARIAIGRAISREANKSGLYCRHQYGTGYAVICVATPKQERRYTNLLQYLSGTRFEKLSQNNAERSSF
jgi:hypothetical protein